MYRYTEAYEALAQRLQSLYDASEAAAIAREVMRSATSLAFLNGKATEPVLTEAALARLYQWTNELLTGRPMQYVLGEAWFFNRCYIVTEDVLIPRPETEELVQWVIDDYRSGTEPLSILDVGTGSGCIPISLQLSLQNAAVTSCDISAGALRIARQNAGALGATVRFLETDFLDESQRAILGQYQIIVSNPPYIPAAERGLMHRNVTDYEPGSALFVPDEDPQLFYRAIARFGLRHLAYDGAIYCELHQDYARDTQNLFEQAGYKRVLIREDINDNRRMLKALI